MQRNNLRLLICGLTLTFGLSTLACSDDGGGDENEGSESSAGDGDGDPAGDGDGDPTGDGDGDPTGDGDGDPTGDGDGDPTGDGDGDPTGDGDGDPTGDGDGDPTGDGDGDPPGDLTFAGDIYPIITNNCSCHTGGASGGLAMPDADTAYANLVGVPSGQNGNLNRIEPGDPMASYLFHKISGIQMQGSQMPLNNAPLSDADQMMVADWIMQGANP